ncbi:MAG: sigma-70 family RNA polymerase sigma factor [Bacteroidota bacterium]
MEKDIHQIIRTNLPFLHHRAQKISPDKEAALDLAQDTILRILEQEAKYDRSKSFRAWSSRVMQNVYINQYNRRKRYRVVTKDTSEMGSLLEVTANNGEDNLNLEYLDSAIAQLKRPHQMAFRLFIEGYEQKEIAQLFEIPVGTVKYHVFEARRVLRAMVQRDHHFAALN